ncbi:MAG: twin-arginine translocase subunit TatB [Bradyrhizobiaceae bacterium]|nr:MAG: twin-arginine translocase subunit TatB [Bradyrhizobiaceae bacterium]
MFDIGWSELVVIGVVALIAIGPKELPGVLRMVGQWIGKARRMAADFQGQFNEAMREAEMADIKKSFDEASAAAKDLHPTNLLGNLNKEIEDAVSLDQPKIDPPVMTPTTEPVTQSSFAEGEAHALMVEKAPDASPAPPAPDAKAS